MHVVIIQSTFITLSVSTSENGTDAKLQYRLVVFDHYSIVSRLRGGIPANSRLGLAGAVGLTKCGLFVPAVISVRAGPFVRTFSTRAIGTMVTHCTISFTTTTTISATTTFSHIWRCGNTPEVGLFLIVEGGWTRVWTCGYTYAN